ncbi:HDIG domain-containing metalloprotein [Halalkalibacter hemicellulosilyticus]|uniref:3'->5' exoribonuclease Bsu YhaM n=1 Tax=Halalkalibacter hemicellulosilyticusJCM 9152 TaxID=1236971 RepID=W4QFI0_9BACI|nr:HDIG domain-containing metalloprotein [Halalkalibacter hemicellulosilyticus]GAE30094.1 3'->5' exoribonuclease Bsu YhaM [Halalkalibacter hemicellulosilyticusJCM 9152]
MISNWNEGEVIVHFFYIREREVKHAANGSDYATFVLERNLQRIQAILWDVTAEQAQQFERHAVVKVEATVGSYRGQKQLTIQRMRLVTKEDQVKVADLLSRDGVDREDLWQELRLYMEEIQSDVLRTMIKTIFGKKSFRERFTTMPAAKMYHHAYYAGLLEHVVEITRSAWHLFPVYPNLNKDVVITTCLLHDIGKTKSFLDATAPELSSEGEFFGHVSVSLDMITQAAYSAGLDLDHPEITHVRHCMGSQLGEVSQGLGSAASPKTEEAIFFSLLKHLNCQLNNMSMLKEQSVEEWTYSPLFKRRVYTKKERE